MKVWVIGRNLPTKKNNMMGSFEYEQAQMLAKNGFEVYYPVVDIRSLRRWRKFGLVRTDDGNMHTFVLNIPIGKLLPSGMRVKVAYGLKEGLYNYIAQKYGIPEIIHVHYPALWSYDLFEKFQSRGVKIVATEHWTRVQNGTLPLTNLRNLRDFTNRCDTLICVGRPLQKSIRVLTGTDREIQVIPNIVSPIFFCNGNNWERKNLFRFVAVGRLVECKRFDLLIDAFADAFKDNPAVVLDIIGEGKERESLERKIADNNCACQIHLLGLMNREEIAQYYKKCNALILSSNLETFGVPVIEAFACGMPVVTTNAIGFPEYINETNGIVIHANDKVQLAAAMEYLFVHYEEYERIRIVEEAKENFSEEAICKQLVNIYTHLAKK